MNLKLLSLNAHGLPGEHRDANTDNICRMIAREKYDVVALQEVDQTEGADFADTTHIESYFRSASSELALPLKKDNFALELFWKLAESGETYYFTWLPIKRGYGIYDEGLALFCRLPIRGACGSYISECRDYNNVNTRMALFCEIESSDLLFCNVHTSRHDASRDHFDHQWERLSARIPENRRVVLLGDFNMPDDSGKDGYGRVISDGYYDIYRIADERIGGRETAVGDIDGWRGDKSGRRIDYIFTNFYPDAERIVYSRVFDGERGQVVSDHFGVSVEIVGYWGCENGGI